MDPITSAIVVALTGKLGETVINDAYQALKTLIIRKWGANSDIGSAVEKLEQEPTSKARKDMLAEEVAKINADKDADLITLANQIHQLVNHSNIQPSHQNIVNQTGEKQVGVNYGDVNFNA